MTHDTTLPADMQDCLRECLATGKTLRRHQAVFTNSSSALAQLLQDWSRRQILHFMQVELQLSSEQAERETEKWLRQLSA